MFLKNLFKSDDQMASNCDESMLYPVLPAEKLLDENRRAVVEQLRILAAAPDNYYAAFYLTLVHRFAEFVQLLPLTDVGPLAELLDNGLQRALITLQVYKENPLKTADPLIMYTLFSAMLLAEIDQACQLKKIIISDTAGAAIKEWAPFEGSMINQGEYYRIRPYQIVYPAEIKLILARMLMPEEAFLWLTRDSKIFRLWLAIFLGQEDEETTRGVKNILSLIKEKIDTLIEAGEGLQPIRVKPIEPTDTAIGEEFLHWLKEGLHNQSISVNQEDSKIHILHEGAIITHPDLFKEFSKVAKHRDWVVVQQQFNFLGLAKLSGYDKKFEQFFSESSESISKKFSTFTNNKRVVSPAKTGVLLASEWLYTSPSTAIPAVSATAELSRRDTLSKKRLWPQLETKSAPVTQPKSPKL